VSRDRRVGRSLFLPPVANRFNLSTGLRQFDKPGSHGHSKLTRWCTRLQGQLLAGRLPDWLSFPCSGPLHRFPDSRFRLARCPAASSFIRSFQILEWSCKRDSHGLKHCSFLLMALQLPLPSIRLVGSHSLRYSLASIAPVPASPEALASTPYPYLPVRIFERLTEPKRLPCFTGSRMGESDSYQPFQRSIRCFSERGSLLSQCGLPRLLWLHIQLYDYLWVYSSFSSW
jgi:hypothetical protein